MTLVLLALRLVGDARCPSAIPGAQNRPPEGVPGGVELFPESGAILFESYHRVVLNRFPSWPYMLSVTIDSTCSQ